MRTVTAIRLIPLATWVLVRPRVIMSDVTEAGIVKVDFSTEKPQTGDVLAIGPDLQRSAWNPTDPQVNPGDVVLYGKYAGTEVDFGDGDALVLDIKDILARVDFVEMDVEDEADDPRLTADGTPSLIDVATR